MKTFDTFRTKQFIADLEQITGTQKKDWVRCRVATFGLPTERLGKHYLVTELKSSGAYYLFHLFDNWQELKKWERSRYVATKDFDPEDPNARYRKARNTRYTGHGWGTKEIES